MEVLERAGVVGVRSEQFARFQSDAPACDNCGAITVRNGKLLPVPQLRQTAWVARRAVWLQRRSPAFLKKPGFCARQG